MSPCCRAQLSFDSTRLMTGNRRPRRRGPTADWPHIPKRRNCENSSLGFASDVLTDAGSQHPLPTAQRIRESTLHRCTHFVPTLPRRLLLTPTTMGEPTVRAFRAGGRFAAWMRRGDSTTVDVRDSLSAHIFSFHHEQSSQRKVAMFPDRTVTECQEVTQRRRWLWE